MANEKANEGGSVYVEGLFPSRGLDVSCEYGRQPAGTAPAGVNVRAFDAGADRQRGGSRSGLSRLIDETVSGAFEIQDLVIIVTTDPVNLTAAVTPPIPFLGFYLLDPSTGSRNPGRWIPIGGSGVMPNRNVSNIDQDENDPGWLAGSVVSGNSTANYSVSLVGGGTGLNVHSVSGTPELPAGSGVIVLKKDETTYLMQPSTWGS